MAPPMSARSIGFSGTSRPPSVPCRRGRCRAASSACAGAWRRPVARRRHARHAAVARPGDVWPVAASLRRCDRRCAMSVVVHARVVEQLTRLRLRYVAERIDAMLNDAAREAPTYLDFLDAVLRQEVDAKQRTRTTMGLK